MREPLNNLNYNAHKGAFTQASIPMPIKIPSHIVDGVDKIEGVPSLGWNLSLCLKYVYIYIHIYLYIYSLKLHQGIK